MALTCNRIDCTGADSGSTRWTDGSVRPRLQRNGGRREGLDGETFRSQRLIPDSLFMSNGDERGVRIDNVEAVSKTVQTTVGVNEIGKVLNEN